MKWIIWTAIAIPAVLYWGFFGLMVVSVALAVMLENHNDKEENLNNCRPVKLLSNTTRNTLDEAKLQYEGKIFTPEKDEDGFWHCDECFLSLQYWNEGHVKLKNVTNNTNEKTKIKYPYYAGYEKIIQ